MSGLTRFDCILIFERQPVVIKMSEEIYQYDEDIGGELNGNGESLDEEAGHSWQKLNEKLRLKSIAIGDD